MNYYITTFKNLGRGLFSSVLLPKNSDKNIPKVKKSFDFDLNHYKKYKKMTEWTNESIHPIYPYCLITDLHFLLVSNQGFPYSSFGFLHQREEIKPLKKLCSGKWEFFCELLNLTKDENQITFFIETKLFINGVLSWTSKTHAIKKLSVKKKSLKDYVDYSSFIKDRYYLKTKKALDYGILSFNLDPIHTHPLSARFMGHKSNIMHGMWGVAFSFSKFMENNLVCLEEMNFSIKFISPMFLPRDISYFCDEKSETFGLYAIDKKCPHLLIKASKML